MSNLFSRSLLRIQRCYLRVHLHIRFHRIWLRLPYEVYLPTNRHVFAGRAGNSADFGLVPDAFACISTGVAPEYPLVQQHAGSHRLIYYAVNLRIGLVGHQTIITSSLTRDKYIRAPHSVHNNSWLLLGSPRAIAVPGEFRKPACKSKFTKCSKGMRFVNQILRRRAPFFTPVISHFAGLVHLLSATRNRHGSPAASAPA